MTAIRQRRRRAMAWSLVAALGGLAAAAGIGLAGARSLADSTAGTEAEAQDATVPTQRLPLTSTALVAVADEDDRITSVVAMALSPNGVGGSIIGIAASADAASGTRNSLAPVASVFAIDGPDAYLAAGEALTGMTFDVVEVIEPRRFAQLIAPLGDVPYNFPQPMTDSSTEETWTSGDGVLSSPAMARAITAVDDAGEDWYLEANRAAIWRAVADRVGAGIGDIAPIADDENVPVPRNLDEFVDRLFAAPVEFRALGFEPIDADRVAEQLDERYVGVLGGADAVVAHNRAELAIVFGSIAPARIGAPLDAPAFRIESTFSTSDVEAVAASSSEVLRVAVDRLLFAQVNVVSVVDLPSPLVPEVTEILVDDGSTMDAIRELAEPIFGDVVVDEAAIRTEGVDVTVRLGRSFLEEVRGDSAAAVAGSG